MHETDSDVSADISFPREPRFQISKRIVLINSVSSAVAMILNVSVLVWLQQYLIKRISPEEYSLLPLLTSIMVFTPLLNAVLTGGLGRYMTVAYARGDDREVTRICSTMFPILCAAALITMAVGGAIAWNIDRLLIIDPRFRMDARIMMAMLMFSAAMHLLLAPFGSAFMMRQKLMLRDMINVGCQFLRIGVLFTFLFGVSTRVLWVVTASVTAELVELAITVPIAMHLVPAQRFRWNAIHWPIARELTSYGGWTLLTQLAGSLRQAMDPIILNQFATSLDVSAFYVGGVAARILGMLLTPITRPFIPVLAAMHATGDIVRLRNTYLRTARYNAWAVLIIAVPAIVFSNETMTLYTGARYKDAGIVMALLLAVSSLYALNALGAGIACAVGDMKGLALRSGAVQVANLTLTFWLVAYAHKGALGSALATLLAVLFVESTLLWPFCRRLTRTSVLLWLQEAVSPALVSAAPALAFCLAVKYIKVLDSWVSLFTFSSISAFVFIFSVCTLGLRRQDHLDIQRAFARIPYIPLRNFGLWLYGHSSHASRER